MLLLIIAFFALYIIYRCLFKEKRHGYLKWNRSCLPFRSTWFHHGFQWRSCYSIFSFMCMFCRSLFVFLFFFFWSLFCLSFFDLRILITPLVSWPLCSLSFYDLQILITPLVSSNSSFSQRIFDYLVFHFFFIMNVHFEG